MEMHLSSVAHADTTEFQQLSSLYRLLKRAVATRSEHEILRTFVEALAVWQDAESLAYLGDVTGRFVLDVSLPGFDRSSVPLVLAGDLILGDMTTMRLPPAEREALGFHGPTDVILSRIRGRATSEWVIASCAPADSFAEARLAVYVEAVSQALTEMAAVESSRLTWAMLQHLLPTTDAVDRAAQSAIDAVSSAIDGEISLAVSRDGSRVLTIGDPKDLVLLAAPMRSPSVLTIPVDVPAPFISVIGVRRTSDRPLAGREERLLQSAASTLGAWLGMVAPRLPTRKERRTRPRSFDQLMEQAAREEQAEEKDFSFMFVELCADPPGQHITRTCVAQIRGQLRPSDMAGRLSSGHIGVVLPDTPPIGATAVAERLRRLVKGNFGFGEFSQASVVLGTPSAGMSTGDSQVQVPESCARVLNDVRLMRGCPN